VSCRSTWTGLHTTSRARWATTCAQRLTGEVPARYLCLGEVSHTEHQGERPISITWRLHRPMPQDLLSKGAVEAG
jgi:hypothetical protein